MKILIVGGTGGIGGALLQTLHNQLPTAHFIATYYVTEPSFTSNRVHWVSCDISSEQQIAHLASSCNDRLGSINWCINSVGLLHDNVHRPEKTIKHLSAEFFSKNVQINTLPTLLLARHLTNVLDKSQPGIFATVSARVGSIGENQLGGWYSYRCSKAALNMALKTLSIEWQRTLPHLCVAALHPGTTETKLSAPFTGRLASDRLFSAERCALQLIKILTRLSSEDTGKFWSWDGSELPW